MPAITKEYFYEKMNEDYPVSGLWKMAYPLNLKFLITFAGIQPINFSTIHHQSVKQNTHYRRHRVHRRLYH